MSEEDSPPSTKTSNSRRMLIYKLAPTDEFDEYWNRNPKVTEFTADPAALLLALDLAMADVEVELAMENESAEATQTQK